MEPEALDHLKTYLERLRVQQRRSPQTLLAYRRDLDQLQQFLTQHEMAEWGQVDTTHPSSLRG